MTGDSDALPHLDMWTVYDRPADFPDRFIARRWEVDRNGPRWTSDYIWAYDLDTLRSRLPPGLFCMPRQDDDEPQIVESWL